MKLLNNKTLILLLLFVSGAGYIVSCTRDNNMIVPVQLTQPFVATRGTAVLSPGTMTTGDPTQWKLDKVHSSCLWSTKYVGAAGLLTGRFNQFGIHDVTDAKAIRYNVASTVQPLLDSSWYFNEADPTKTYINGYVQINTSNTGEPGRDQGCNVAGMGTTALEPGVQMLNYPNLAKIKSTKVEFDPASNGYIVTLALTYQGKLAAPLTKTIIGKLNYVKKQTVQFGTAAAYDVFGFQLKFSFNCRDFGINSTSIADNIDIECNMNFNNK
jgi:polyisoprenoid-binding protein YceI